MIYSRTVKIYLAVLITTSLYQTRIVLLNLSVAPLVTAVWDSDALIVHLGATTDDSSQTNAQAQNSGEYLALKGLATYSRYKQLTTENEIAPLTTANVTESAQQEIHRNSTLALLYPPGLLDGYHNQVMRFIAFVLQAKQRGLTQLFLPSLLWSTQLHDIGAQVHGSPIPMEWVFDIDHWNSFSEHLPRIVAELPDSDCWAPMSEISVTSKYWPSNWTSLNHLDQEALSRGAFRELANLTVGYIMKNLLSTVNPRDLDVLPLVKHCREPQAYGGGTGGARTGHLWQDYTRILSNPNVNGSVAPYQVDKWVLMALQPAPHWKYVAEQCVASNTRGSGDYLAVHARVELDMLAHTHCSQHMEQNLTKILQLAESLSQNISVPLSSTFMAISRYGLEIKNWKYKRYQMTADDNLRTYYRMTGYNHTQRPESGIGSDAFPVFQCGEPALSKFYQKHAHVPDHGYLLHSVLDFYVAVNAFAFIGPSWGSTFTRDVWIARYHLGKGDRNYQYTKEGWEKVGNDGLPNMHGFC